MLRRVYPGPHPADPTREDDDESDRRQPCQPRRRAPRRGPAPGERGTGEHRRGVKPHEARGVRRRRRRGVEDVQNSHRDECEPEQTDTAIAAMTRDGENQPSDQQRHHAAENLYDGMALDLHAVDVMQVVVDAMAQERGRSDQQADPREKDDIDPAAAKNAGKGRVRMGGVDHRYPVSDLSSVYRQARAPRRGDAAWRQGRAPPSKRTPPAEPADSTLSSSTCRPLRQSRGGARVPCRRGRRQSAE